MDEPSPPYHAYAAITGTFVGLLGVTALAARLLGLLPPVRLAPRARGALGGELQGLAHVGAR